MEAEDETWAQTLITVTPEKDATIREISETTTLSATKDTYLDLGPDNIVYRRSSSTRQFVDSTEAKVKDEVQEEVKKDGQTQTYLKGIPTIHISLDYMNESSQTMYMSPPYPSLKYFKDIMTSMHGGPMPKLKKSNVATTIISFYFETPEDIVMGILTAGIGQEECEDFVSKLSLREETEMEATEVLYFVIARALWIIDPKSLSDVNTSDEATQTSIMYNKCTKMFVTGRETQTDLTCEPKQSHTHLLANYWETKNMILNYLESCIFEAIDTRVVINDIIDEIVGKGAELVRYPMKEQVVQTIASYKLRGEREEDVMRKLRLEIIVDPFEASIAVVPIMDDLLHLASAVVSRNAVGVSRAVLRSLFQRISTIIAKLVELQEESQRKPIDQVLAKRKEKILELMSKKETISISTQTSIAAIAEVKKIQKSQEILCSVCREPSMCQWCVDNGKLETASRQEVQILRTQDILLAYKPCYIISKAPHKERYVLQPPCPEKKAKPRIAQKVVPPVDSSGESRDTIRISLRDRNEIECRESFNEWSYVRDDTLMKEYSVEGSVCNSCQATITLVAQPMCQDTSVCRKEALTSEAANALQILKQTFCNQKTCNTSSLPALKKDYWFTGNNDSDSDSTSTSLSQSSTENKICYQNICRAKQHRAISKLHASKANTSSHTTSCHKKSYGDGFKIIPICISDHSST